jgi:hypothetical protein
MEIYELVIEMKLLERRLSLYEEKYGVLSEDFHGALSAGKLEGFDEYDETRVDFSRWKGFMRPGFGAKKHTENNLRNASSPRPCAYSQPINR